MVRKRSKNRQSSSTGRGGRRDSRMTRRQEQYRPIVENAPEALAQASPLELYRREKARRLGNPTDTSELLEEARREYKALLAADAAKGKGGRPRKSAAPARTLDIEYEE